MYNFDSFSTKSHLVCVNLVLLDILCKKWRCFPGKFTQLAKILHDRRSWRSRQISTLVGSVIFDCLSGWSYDWIYQVPMVGLTRKNCSKDYYEDMKDRTGNHFYELEWRRMISFTANKIIEESLQASFKWIPSIDVDFWSDTSTNYWCGKSKIIKMN